MDIYANGETWGFAMMGIGGFTYTHNKKDNSITLKASKKACSYPLTVQTPRGVFIETLDKNGDVIQDGGDGDWYYVDLSAGPCTLKYRALPDVGMAPSQINRHRKKVTRYLIDDQPYSAGVPDTLIGHIKWAQELLEKIPEASRKTAKCDFDTSTAYGETYPNVKVSYDEPESDEEVVARVQIERERERIMTQNRRAQFERLKSEFDSKDVSTNV